MKLLKFSVTALLALGMAFLGGCSDDDGIDNRDQDYGYVQFKLHKEASYDALSRAQKPQLDYLTYEGETTNAVMNVPTYSSFMAQGDAESWLTAESYGPTQIYVNMDSQTATEGVMFLYGANWNVVMVIICTLNI